MNRKFMIFIFLTLLVIFANFGYAAQTIKVGLGSSLYPWVIPKSDSGIVVDIIRECLEPAGFTLENIYRPYVRRINAYKNGKIDAICDIKPKTMADTGLEGHLSTVAYAYENIAIALKENKIRINKISDLAGYSLVSWQGAKNTLGEEYSLMASNNKRYKEIEDQEIQIKLLFSGRTDVIQLDRQIFNYFRNKIHKELGFLDTKKSIDIFPLFKKNKCSFLFRDKKTQLIFDSQLKKLKESGDYEKIYERYHK